MGLKAIGKLAATLMLGASLAGCIDATVEVELTSDTTGRAILTQTMGADFYGMVKMSQEESESEEPAAGFCDEGELTEEADGGATCIIAQEGTFDELASMGEDDDALTFTSAGPGLVRIALPTAEMQGSIGSDDEMDAESRDMLEAFFAGRSITIRMSGAEVTETNMTLSDDKKSAETVLPFLDLINGSAELPEEFFAVVRAP